MSATVIASSRSARTVIVTSMARTVKPLISAYAGRILLVRVTFASATKEKTPCCSAIAMVMLRIIVVATAASNPRKLKKGTIAL